MTNSEIAAHPKEFSMAVLRKGDNFVEWVKLPFEPECVFLLTTPFSMNAPSCYLMADRRLNGYAMLEQKEIPLTSQFSC